MSARIKVLIILVLLTFLGIGPMPITSVIGIYIVIFRPPWFKKLVLEIYDDSKS